jgi:hypothetical protein
MKLNKVLLILFAISICQTAHSRDPQWVRTMGFAGTKDIGGATGLERSGFLMAMNSDGSLQFETVLKDPDGLPLEFSGLAATDDALYAVGSLGVHPESAGVVVVAFEADGGIRWQKTLVGTDEEFGTNVIATRDGGLLLVGASLPAGEFIGDGLVVKMDANGDIEWQTQIGTPGWDFFSGAVERRDGGFLLAGGVGTKDNPSFNLNGWIVSLDPAGALEWQKGYMFSSGDSLNQIILTRKEIWAFGNICGNCFAGGGDGWFLRTDLQGNVISSDILGDFAAPGPADFIHRAVAPAHGPGAFLLGSSDSTDGISREIFVARLNGKGALLWLKQIGTDGFDEAQGFAALRSGGVAIGGLRSTPTDAQDILVARLDKGGRGLSDCHNVSDLPGEFVRDTFNNTVPAPELGAVLPSSLTAQAGTLVEDPDSSLPNHSMLCLD